MVPLPLPAFDVTSSLAPFVAIAIPMVVITVAVLGLVRPRDGRSPLVTQLLLAVAVIGGGSTLLLALLFVFIDTNGTTAWTWVLVGFNFMMVAPVGLWLVGHIVYEDRRVASGDWTWPAGIGIAVTGSEVLMGLLFVLGGVGDLGLGGTFTLGLSSVWFFWSMAAIMAPLVLWAPLSPLGRTGAWALVAAAVIGPWVRPYPLVGGILMAGAMGAVLALLLRPIWRGTAPASDSRLLVGLGAAFLAMTVSGLAVAATAGSVPAVLAFGSTMAVVMIAEVSYLLRRSYASSPDARPSPAPRREPAPVGSGAPAGPSLGP
jgi:hypothetical protein